MSLPETPPQTLRIIDATLNRIAEGLRVREDIARFSLNDADLSRTLQSLRHELIPGNAALNLKPVAARDPEADAGANSRIVREGTYGPAYP